MIDRKTLRILRKRDRGLYDRIITVLRMMKGRNIEWSGKGWTAPADLPDSIFTTGNGNG